MGDYLHVFDPRLPRFTLWIYKLSVYRHTHLYSLAPRPPSLSLGPFTIPPITRTLLPQWQWQSTIVNNLSLTAWATTTCATHNNHTSPTLGYQPAPRSSNCTQ